ncbi:glycosyltransferase [Streptococcus himalayensis]|uniref:Glycosyl transferase n=1 Tax=Streptococcus himalayensis TaxID=1888195 RepID=A0A917A2B3_9STRE|nr:glycosyltransferase [Streptococcus himalayensis]GGE22973.1 glycosyl transferase [Streptococcus himalayensis]
MRVLIQSRANFNEMPGGDTIQILKTKEQLEKLGVEVDISLELEPDLSNYDLVHLTNITRIHETYIQMKNAKSQGKPVALSTIFWPMEEFEQKGQHGLRKLLSRYLNIDNIERLKILARGLKNWGIWDKSTVNLLTVGYTDMQKFVIENTDIFLPNAELEMQMLNKVFGVQKKNYIVVPNAIDKDIVEKYRDVQDTEFEEYKDAIICVGRIEARKNQLALLQALQDTDYKVILVGKVSDNFKKYFESIKDIVDKNENFFYIESIPNDKLYKLFKLCRVSVLPSWLDTPGLVSLEAAAMGCSLAVSHIGTTVEYFGEEAFYCSPDDIESIKRAVDQAYNKRDNSVLQNKILTSYTWEEAAKGTLEAYKKITQKI